MISSKRTFYSFVFFIACFIISFYLFTPLIYVLETISDGLKYSTVYSSLLDISSLDIDSLSLAFSSSLLWLGDFSPAYFLLSLVLSFFLPSYPLFLIFLSSLFLSQLFYLYQKLSIPFIQVYIFLFASSFYSFYILFNNPRLLTGLISVLFFLILRLSRRNLSYLFLLLSPLFHPACLFLLILVFARPFVERLAFSIALSSFKFPIQFFIYLSLFFVALLFFAFLYYSKISVYMSASPAFLLSRLPSSLLLSLFIVSAISLFRSKISIDYFLFSLLFLSCCSFLIGADKVNPIYWFCLFVAPCLFSVRSLLFILPIYILMIPKTLLFVQVTLKGLDFYGT